MRGGAPSGQVGRKALRRAAWDLVTESFLVLTDTGVIDGAVAGLDAPAGIEEAAGVHAFRLVHPDDLPGAFDLSAEARDAAPGWRGTTLVRLRDRNGCWRRFEALVEKRAETARVPGYLVRLLPSAAEGAPERRRSAEVELESLAGAVPVPILFLSSGGAVHYANRAAEQLLGQPAARLRALGVGGLVAEDDRDRIEEALACLGSERAASIATCRLAPGSGPNEGRLVELTLSARGRAGEVNGVVVTLLDVTARQQETAELERRASRDPLTGLLNRSSLEQALDERLRDEPERVALLYCDLDGFKTANDTFGHRTGDELLCDIARGLETVARPGAIAGRHGGDEFALVVEVDSPADTLSLVLDLEEAVAKAARGRGLEVTASVGAATGRPGDSALDMLHRADLAMYARKRERSSPGRTRALAGGTRPLGWEFTQRSRGRDDEETQL